MILFDVGAVAFTSSDDRYLGAVVRFEYSQESPDHSPEFVRLLGYDAH